MANSRDDASQADVWAILYEDASRTPEVFVGAGAEDAARRRYDQSSINWNCHLLAAIRAAPPTTNNAEAQVSRSAHVVEADQAAITAASAPSSVNDTQRSEPLGPYDDKLSAAVWVGIGETAEHPDTIALRAWQSAFGTTQLTHARAAFEEYKARAARAEIAQVKASMAADGGSKKCGGALSLLALLAETPPIQRWKEYEDRGEERIPCFIQVETAKAIAEFFPSSVNEQGVKR